MYKFISIQQNPISIRINMNIITLYPWELSDKVYLIDDIVYISGIRVTLQKLDEITIVVINSNGINFIREIEVPPQLGYSRLKVVNLLKEDIEVVHEGIKRIADRPCKSLYRTFRAGNISLKIKDQEITFSLLNQTNNILLLCDKIRLIRTNKVYIDYGQKDFDLIKFMGKWYGDKNELLYTLNGIKVDIISKDLNLGLESIKYSAVIEDSNVPWLITVNLDNIPNKLEKIVIHETDYTSYALLGSPERTYYQLLTRDREKSKSIKNRVKILLDQLGYS